MNLDYKLLKKMNYISSKSIAIINSIENKNIEDEIKTYSNSFIIDTIEKNKVSRNLGEETIPFSFDVVRFKEGCGLYIVVEYKTIEDYDWMRERFANLGFTGIGGMVSAGYGKFEISDIIAETIYYISTIKRLKYGKNLFLSTAVSKNINKSFLDNSFELVKRSGFISSVNFTNGVLKKKLVYAIKSGALFDDKFEGDILDVAPIKGNHPIYRFLLPLFIEV
jgi:CRISPR-associated protein Csm4